jgi:hypothetical protein
VWKSLWVTCCKAVRRPADFVDNFFYPARAAKSIVIEPGRLSALRKHKILYNRRFFANMVISAKFYESSD